MKKASKIALYIMLLVVLGSLAFAATKPIAGYVKLHDGSNAENATVIVYVNTSFGGVNPCYTDPAVFSGNDSSFSTNLGNLKRNDNDNDCSGLWAQGDVIWAEADGSSVIPLPQGNGSVSDTVGAGTGLQYLNNITLAAGPDLTGPVVTLISPVNNTNSTTGDVSFTYNVTDFSSVNSCSIIFNNVLNTTDNSITQNVTQDFNFTFMSDGLYNWSVNCTDSESNQGSSEVRILNVSKIGNLQITQITPAGNTDVEQNQFFEYTTQITCLEGNCGNVNASLDPIPIPENPGIVVQALNFVWGILGGGQLVPTTPTKPFWTNTSNPADSSDFSCLANMAYGDSCNVTWWVNASGGIGIEAEFFAFANSTDYANVGNETIHFNITITESIKPDVTALIPTQGSQFNESQNIEIGTSATDNINISVVFANLTYPNSSVQRITLNRVGLTDKYNISYTLPNKIGNYSVLVFANDTSNNINNTELTWFEVLDPTNPTSLDPIPTENSSFNTSQSIEVGINASDNVALDVVLANVTNPQGSSSLITLTNVAGTNKYNSSYSIPSILGRYNITFIINDTSNNINDSTTTYFNAFDAAAPPFTNLKESPLDAATYLPNQFYEFNVTVTDNIDVDEVWIEFNGTNYTLEVGNVSSEYIFNRSDLAVGTYSYTWFANDTSGNINQTSNTYTVNQATPIVNLTLNGQDSNITIEVESSVTLNGTLYTGEDNVQLFRENSLINSGAQSLENVSLFNTLGTFNITVAYDQTQNYSTNFESHYVIVQDTILPNVTQVSALPSTITFPQSVSINATVVDNYQVNSVLAQITMPNGTALNLTMSNTSSQYNVSFAPTITHPGGTYNVLIFANDTANNANFTQNTSFTVTEAGPPSVFDLRPVQGSSHPVNTSIEVAANVTDSSGVDTVFANITLPNGSIERVGLTKVGGTNKYNISYDLTLLLGSYNVSYFANDTAGNINSTQTSYFTSQDVTGPQIGSLSESPSDPATYLEDQFYQFNATITDNIAIDSVVITFNGVNYTSQISNVSTVYVFNRTDLTRSTYSYTWYANDSSGNWSSLGSDYTINRAQAVVNLTLNEQDSNITLEAGSSVTFNATRLAGQGDITLYQQSSSINTGAPNLINTSEFNTLGTFNITVWYDQTQNFSSTYETHYVIVQDTTPPNVTQVSALPSPANQTQSVSLNATILDNTFVSTAIAQVTMPNGTVLNLTMSNISSAYNVSFVPNPTHSTGTYNVLIFANDTSNNVNFTQNTSFVVADTVPPSVNLVSPTNQKSTNNSTVVFNCSGSDNSGLVNITLYHNISGLFSSNQSVNVSGTSASSEFSINNIAEGLYIWNCLVKDDTSNVSFAASNYSFRIDQTPPSVTNLQPNSSHSFTYGSTISINATVSDDVAVGTVLANITLPNGTISQVTLTNITSTIYEYNYSIANLTGQFNYTIIANDSAGNINSSEISSFNAVGPSQDLTVTLISPANGQDNQTSSTLNMTFSCNASDDANLVNISLHLTNKTNQSLVRNQSSTITGLSNESSWTLTLAQGNYHWNCLAFNNESNSSFASSNYTLDITAPAGGGGSSSSSSSSGGGGGGGSSSSSGGGGGGGIFTPCDEGYSRVNGTCVEDEPVEEEPAEQEQDGTNQQEEQEEPDNEGQSAGSSENNKPENSGSSNPDADKANLAGFATGFDAKTITGALVTLLLLLLLLLLFFLWRKHQQPKLLVRCPPVVEQGEVMQVKVLVKNGGHHARITLWGFVNERLAPKLKKAPVPPSGAGKVVIDLKAGHKKKEIIPITIPRNFAVDAYTLITCAKLEWGIEEKTIAVRNNFTVIEPVHFRHRTSVEFRKLIGKLRERVPVGRTLPQDIAKQLYAQSHVPEPVVQKIERARDLELESIESRQKMQVAKMRAKILEIEKEIERVVGNLEKKEEDVDIEYLRRYEDKRLSKIERYYRQRRELLDREPRKYLDKLLDERGRLVMEIRKGKKKK